MTESQNKKRRRLVLLKRWIALLLVLCMMLSDGNLLNLISYAAEAGGSNSGRSINVSLTRKSGGTKLDDETNDGLPDNLKNDDRMVLLANGNPVVMDLTMDPGFRYGRAQDLHLDVALPYFYYNGDNQLVTTYNYNEIPEDQRSDGKLMGVQAKVTDYRKNFYNQSHEQDTTMLYNGTFKLSAIGIDLIYGQPLGVVVEFSFFGNVPENTAGVIMTGGSYEKYIDEDENVDETGYTLELGKGEASTYTIINSSLTWEFTASQVGTQVLWDKYNYLTYKVTIKNTSEKETCYFEPFALNFEIPCYAQSTKGGILDEDLMAWIYNKDSGEVTKNEQINISANNYYTGKPSQGGILVYDVTDKTDSELATWNTETYENVTETPMYYSVTNNRMISIPVDQKVGDGEPKERSYYIAVPFTNNFPYSVLSKIATTFYPTIYLGNIKWTKTLKFSGKFDEPNPQFTHEKYAIDVNGKTQKTATAAIDGVGTYYITGFENTGNLPAFNPIVTDTIPDDYVLKKITIQMDPDSKDPDYVPQMSEWFQMTDTLEFGFTDGDGKEVWVNFGEFGNETTTEDGKKEWSVDLSGLVSQINNYLKEHTDCVYNNQMRFHLAERINRGEKFNGRIIVEGITPELATYKNTIKTTWTEKIWAPATATDGAGYVNYPQELKNNTATLKTEPANPIVRGYGYRKKSDGSYEYGTPKDGNDQLTVPLKYHNVGIRYDLGNTSISPAKPAEFNSGDLLPLAGRGLCLEKIVLSKKLLASSALDYIEIEGKDGTTRQIGNYSIDASGNGVIQSSAWSSTITSVSNVKIRFRKFNADVEFDDEAYLLLDGYTDIVGEIKSTSSFETLYAQSSSNKKDTDACTLVSSTIYPNMEGWSYEEKEDGTTSPSGVNVGRYTSDTTSTTISSLSVPKDRDNTGYIFRLFNKSESSAGNVDVWVKFTDTGVKNDVSGGAASIVQGFLLKDITFSSNIDKVGKIKKLYFYDYDQDITDSATEPAFVVDWSEVTETEDGNFVIPESLLTKVETTRIKNIRIEFEDFYGQEDVANPEKLEIKFNGNSNQWDSMNAVMTFTPLDETMANKEMSVTAKLYSVRPDLVLSAWSYNNGENYNNGSKSSTNSSENTNSYSLTVPNKVNDVGYIFKITNSSRSATGEAELLWTFPETGVKNDMTIEGATEIIKGFLIKDITFKNLDNVGVIDHIDFYDYTFDTSADETAATTTPSYTIQGKDLQKEEDGTYKILNSSIADTTRVKGFKITFSEMYGQADMSNKETLEVVIDGRSDWFDYLNAKLRTELLDPTMYGWSSSSRISSVRGILYIKRPALSVHTNISYYDNVTEKSYSASTSGNSDGNQTRLAIPYDREYKWRVSIENTEISILDDVDVEIQLPIKGEGDTTDPNTGFHTIKTVLNKAFLEQFAEFESVTFYDKNSLEGKTYKYVYDETTQTASLELTDEDGNIVEGAALPKNADGNWEFVPMDIGVDNLWKIFFTGDLVKLKDDSTKNAWIDFYGYSDSDFDTKDYIYATTDNYLDGIREERYQVRRKDNSYVTVSKMYFDTVLAAGYKDTESVTATKTEANRFDQTSSAVEHMRDYWLENHCCESAVYFLDDSELDVGYKSIGSFMLDFRQYLNVGTNYPNDYPIQYSERRSNSYTWQEHQGDNWFYTQSLNTAANVSMEMTLPDEFFDAYYIKVHPKAISYLDQIKVQWKDGTTKTYGKSDWAADKVQSVETDDNGNYYYVISLLQLANGQVSNYVSPNAYGDVVNPVTNITFTIEINKNVSTDGSNADNPDYGTWYDARNDATKYMFEVTGRFYKSNDAAGSGSKTEAKVNTTLTVGGTQHEGAKKASKVRVDSGDLHNNTTDKNRSKWSLWNKYMYHYQCTHNYWAGHHYTCYYASADYDGGHLVSTARVYVRGNTSALRKGAHDPNTQSDTTIEYGTKQYYEISFWRTSNQYENNYAGGMDSANWKNQDADDWSGKLAYVDELYLEDTLPSITNDQNEIQDVNVKYKGFLTEDIQFSADLWKYIDHVTFTYKDKDGNTVNVDKTKDEITASTTNTGFYEVLIKYEEREETLTDGSSNEILLPTNFFLTSYKVTLKDLEGSGDYARELSEKVDLQEKDPHGGSSDTDIRIGGRVYSVTGLHTTNWGTNTVVGTYKNYDMASPKHFGTDDALMMGYQIAFSAGWNVDRLTTDTEYDYMAQDDAANGVVQNVTPDVTSFGVEMWNRPDASTEGIDQTARLKYAKATNTLPDAFNLKKIYIPSEFVEGNWFRMTNLTLNYYDGLKSNNSGSTSFTIADLKKDTATGDYYLDVNEFLIDAETSGSIKLATSTYSNTAETYIKEHIKSFVIEFEAAHPDVENDRTLLDGGEYLSANKNATTGLHEKGYAFTYDGVWVERTEDDFKNDKYTEYSRPTFGMDPNLYDGTRPEFGLSASFKAADMNAKPSFVASSGTDSDINDLDDPYETETFWVRNLVGQMVVRVDRSTGNDFAYDRNKVSDTTRTTTIEEHGVDSNHLIPYDYVNYTLTAGASSTTAIPLQHIDLRFEVPKGQRIVGWELVDENITSVDASDITATVNDGTGATADVTIQPNHYYVAKADGTETIYREINITVGAKGGQMDEDMLKAGEGVKVMVYTQLTNEIAESSSSGSSEGTTISTTYSVVSRPKHTYSQYSIFGLDKSEAGASIQGKTDATGSGSGYRYYSDTSISNAASYYNRYYTDFYRVNGTPYKGNDYTAVTTNYLKFRSMNDNLSFSYTYTDSTAQYDRQGMEIVMYNNNSYVVTNDTRHTLKEITYEVSFMKKENDKWWKVFEMTEIPTFYYPENMDNHDEEVEMLFLVAEDTWVGPDKLVETAEGEEAPEGKYSVRDVMKVKWTYKDIPYMGNDGAEVCFASATNPFKFVGLGLYNNTRKSESDAIEDRFTMRLEGTMNAVHEHVEERTDIDGNTYEITGEVNFAGSGSKEQKIARERPIVTYQTQIFDTENEAKDPYVYNKAQKTGYRPGETMWYKVTVKNNKLTSDQASSGMQGVLLNPVFYDKIPSYVTPDMDKIQIRWLDENGDEKTTHPTLKISSSKMEAPDYGGDMVTAKQETVEGARGNSTGALWTDIVPNATNSTTIEYTVYEFSFPEGTRLEVGEQIEIWYPVTANTSDTDAGDDPTLPMNYSEDKDGNVYPEYWPKIGTWYQYYFKSGSYSSNGRNGISWPLGNSGRTQSGVKGAGSTRTINNSSRMMDMNYLIHDVGVSGTLNKDIDRYELLKESTTYIPGSSENSETNVSYNAAVIYGANNRYMDEDSASYNAWQQVKYQVSLTGTNRDILPTGIEYQGLSNVNRDIYKMVVAPRTKVEGSNSVAWDGAEEGEHLPILWSEARTHLQTAWLATSTEIIPDTVEGDTDTTTVEYANHAKQYLMTAYTKLMGYGVSSPFYTRYVAHNTDGEASDRIARQKLFSDDCIPTLEYDETYTARLSAYNYGDWDLDGVEFIYVLPRGMSPIIGEDDKVSVSGKVLTSGNSSSSVESSNYTSISPDDIQVEIIQDPENGIDAGYQSPKSIQDPVLSQSSWNTTSDVYDEQYYSEEDSYSYVLKITVKHQLKRWFNRGNNKEYILHVDVRCHVDTTNESQYWYDKVFTRPIEIPGVGTDRDSDFYQIYDVTSWAGNTKEKSVQAKTGLALSTQYLGMDYLWDGYDNDYYDSVDTATNYNNGSPNTPYINGINIQNNEVFVTTDDVNGTVAAGDLHDHYAKGKTGTYASTGTRAQMRKPMIRTWTTLTASAEDKDKLGDSWKGNQLSEYYVDTEGEQLAVNIHLENKYYWDEMATEDKRYLGHDNHGYDCRDVNAYMKHLHNYSTDGGNEGTLFFPVVTDILPAGIVPMYKGEDGKLYRYTEDNEENKKHQVDWVLYDKNGNSNATTEAEQALYTATAEYIKVTNEEGYTEGRYKVVIYQDQTKQGDNPDAKIVSGDKRIFSIRSVTVQDPDIKKADGTIVPDLLKQYQTNRIYVTSQLPGFQFKIDSDIKQISGFGTSNLYYVGSYWTPYYDTAGTNSNHYGVTTSDNNRTDSVKRSFYLYYNGTDNYYSGGVLPDSKITILRNLVNGASGVTYAVNDTITSGGDRRYYETDKTGKTTASDILALEDYETIRNALPLNSDEEAGTLQTDFNMSGSTLRDDTADGVYADSGVYAAMRIRTMSPRIGIVATVSNTIDSSGGSGSISSDKPTHYPTSDFDNSGYKKSDSDHKQYGDILYYTAEISNTPNSNATKGDVHHAKIILTMELPSNVSYEDEYYIEKDGVRYTMDELADAGWQITLRTHTGAENTRDETLVFEIITPGEAKTYEEYLQGKHVAGYFASGDSFKFKIKTVIDTLEEPKTVQETTRNYWDEKYYADMYVNLEDTAGSYTEIEGLTEQSLEQTIFLGEKTDSEEEDYDLDGVYGERYASDRTARVTVLKPSATVRLDTSIKRTQINNPDAGIIIAEDAAIKGATVSKIYMDQAVNTGSAVGEFIVDYRVPHRATTTSTGYEADATSPGLITTITEIRTGKWELPTKLVEKEYDTEKYTSYREALSDKLKLNVYVLLSDDPQNKTYDTPGAYNEYATETNNNWVKLTDKDGKGDFALDANYLFSVEDGTIKSEWKTKIRQIRFVIKAEDTKDEEGNPTVNETQKYTVPQGLRLDIDANTNTDKKEEMDDIDPTRANVELSEDKTYPNNVKENAAYIEINMTRDVSSGNGANMKLHANNFATVWGRYDDTQYAPLSEAARAGYLINVELPVIQKDLTPYYFRRIMLEDGSFKFEWSNTYLQINKNVSSMLKYTSVIKNLSEDEIKAVEIEEEPDNASNPTISVVLPYIQDIDDNNFKYVDAYSEDYTDPEKCFVNTDYTSNEKLTKKQAQWSFMVVDETGEMVTDHQIKGYTFSTYEKKVDLVSGTARKVLTWNFSGYLRPGESILVEYMVPIDTKDYGIMSSDLMNCSSHGFLEGSFKPYIPDSDNTNETYSVETDSRDVNNNGLTISETALIKRVGGVGFDSTRAINRLKYSYSEYDTAGIQVTRPALVPEGTDYSFRSSVVNPGEDDEDGFAKTVIYDVLPHVNDKTIVNESKNDETLPDDRNSKWTGWLLPDTVEVVRAYKTKTGIEETVLVDGNDCEIWVGPFTKDKSGKIVAGTEADLPAYEETTSAAFYQDMYASQTAKETCFVKLSELKKLEKTSPVEYLELSKNILAIWVQVANKKALQLDGGMKYELRYSCHAPLNLVQYSSSITDEEDVINSKMEDNTVLNKVTKYTAWNTFAVQTNEATDIGTKWIPMESPQAGVYLNAPAEKGYIGSYVWYDENFNAVIDEGEYERREEDNRLLFKKATKDIDFDGTADDPGINGVQVELLTENGYPSNKLGEAVVEVEEDGETKYIIIDETTGLKAIDVNGTYLYTTEGPVSYTTEADAYGNNGYFMFSNLTPGNYKLRYTMPEGTYNQYAVTTLESGAIYEAGATNDVNASTTSMDIYRPGDTLPDLGKEGQGDVACDGMEVGNNLIIQTADSIRVDALGENPETYADYDKKMTSYNVGVSKAYVYSGFAWLDEIDDGTNTDNVISDGRYTTGETYLPNVKVTFYEVVDGNLKEAYDTDGKLAECVTDANGKFEMKLYPDRSYVIRTDTGDTGEVLKPSPLTWNTDPLVEVKDNDLKQTADKKQETFVFHTGVRYDANNAPIMNQDGNYGTYDYIGLGYIHSGRGFIGKYVWDDKNYDGIHGSYTSEGATLSEPGIEGVEFILERYYYDTDAVDEDGNVAPKWVKIDETKKVESNSGGTYIFQNVSSYYSKNSKLYLAGYKVRVNLDSIPEGYAITKYHMNHGAEDSDLPTDVTNENSYLLTLNPDDVDSEGMYLIAEEKAADATTDPEYIIEHDGKEYDLTEAKMILDLDLGLTKKEFATLSGKIWDDENYDGLLNNKEVGIEDVKLTLKQYYLNSNEEWIYVSEADTTTVTDANGNYQFDNVKPHVIVDGKYYLTGYRVIVDPETKISGIEIKESHGVTIYRAGDGKDRDSDLTNDYVIYHGDKKDGYSIVAKPVTGTDQDSPYIQTVDGVVYDYIKSVDNPNNDGGLTAYKTADISGTIFDDVDYDGYLDSDDIFAALKDEELIVTKETYYYGYAYEDHDDEIMPLDETETSTQKEEMAWHPYKIQNADGKWIQQTETVVVNEDGTYKFEDVPTQVYLMTEDEDGNETGIHYLAGYRLKISHIPQGFGTTYYQVNNGSMDSSLYYEAGTEAKAEVLDITKTHPTNGYNGSRMEELDGYLIMATSTKEGSHSTYAVVRDYDLLGSRDLTEYNAGFHKEEEGKILGTVFHDKDYDGIYDTDSEEGINGVTVYLDQYYLDADGNWQKVEPEEEEKAYAETITTTVAGEDGIFVFEMVPAKVTVDGIDYLASYRLRIEEIPEGYAVTKLNQRTGENDALDETRDSDLLSGTGEFVLGDGTDPLDGYIVIAKQLTEDDLRNEEYIREYNGMEFDLQASVVVNDYDAGLTDFQPGSIGGTIWVDNSENAETNYNGIQDEGEEGIEGQKVYLTQYIYTKGLLGNSWEKVEDFGEEGRMETLTDADGNYLFENLPVFYETEDGERLLYSYKVEVEELLDGYAVTKYHQGEDKELDSDLDSETLGLTEEDEYIVLAEDVTDASYRNEDYVEAVKIDLFGKTYYYDIVVGRHERSYDGGYTPYLPGSIRGLIWLDYRVDAEDESLNYNGIQDEGENGIAGQKVLLTQYRLVDGEWKLVEDFGTDGQMETLTDEEGQYQFVGLPTYFETEEGERQLLSYRVSVEALMEGLAVTKYRQGEDTSADSDLDADTLDLTDAEEYLILAKDVTDETYRNDKYVLAMKTGLFSTRYYDIVDGVEQTGFDGGYTEYPFGSISGIAFEDKNSNGIYEKKKDKLKAGITIYLKKYYYDTETREWTAVSTGLDALAKTDKNGLYTFDNLPTYMKVGENWYLCGYKLWLKEMPVGYEATKYQQNKGENDSALTGDSLMIIKKGNGWTELMDGYIVVAENNSKASYRQLSNTIGDYDIASTVKLDNYNVGFKLKAAVKNDAEDSNDVNDIVQTGDRNNMILWMVILMMSGLTVAYEGIYRRRKKVRK